MAKTIGSLNVSMGLSITDFISNLDKVKDDLGGLEAITSEASKHFEEDVAGIMGDALHKFAKTSKLGADDALAFAVSLKKLGLDADTITSTLDKFGKGIGKFAKNAGEASKAFAGILGKIGESDKVLLKDIQALESMGVKAFDAIAKELSKVEGKAVSTAEVMKRIASGAVSGKDALKLLTQGGQAPVGGGDAAKESQAKSKLAAFLNHVENKIKSAASSIFSKVTNLIMNPVTAIGGALASYGVYKIYDRAVMAFANTEEILTRIKGLAGEASADRLGGVMNEIANQGRIAQDVVGKLATEFLGLGVSGADAARMIESFGRTSLVAGSGATDVFNKLGEVAKNMTRTGQVSKDDFAALASMGLPVYEALAQRLSMVGGVAISTARATEMMALGLVDTAHAINALAGMSNNAKVIQQAEAQAGTLKGIYARLAGEVEGFFTEFGADIVEALDLKGFSQGLISFMQNLRANFSSLEPALKNIGMILAVVRDVLFDAFKGLVNFFTTMGGADVAVSNIESVRAVVVGFAQQTTNAMKQLFNFSSVMIESLVNKLGGITSAMDVLGGFGAGFGSGFVAGGVGGLITGPGAGVTAIGGGLAAGTAGAITAYLKGGSSDAADMADFRTKMGAMFDEISANIGASGGDAATTFMNKFIGKIQVKAMGLGTTGENFAIAGMGQDIAKFYDQLAKADIGYSTFLNSVQGGTQNAIAVFKREMDLKKLSAEQFAEKIKQLSEGAMTALDNKFAAGQITIKEYDAATKKLKDTFDALKPPKDIEIKVTRPAWLENVVNELTPLEKYNQGIAVLMNPKMPLTATQFGKGAKFLADELERSVGAMEVLKNPAALMQGSSAAFSQVLKIQNAGKGEAWGDKLVRIAQQDAAQNKENAATFKIIAGNGQNQNNMVIAQIP